MSCAKTTEPIEMQFGMLSWVGPGNLYYMGCGCPREGTLWGVWPIEKYCKPVAKDPRKSKLTGLIMGYSRYVLSLLYKIFMSRSPMWMYMYIFWLLISYS